MLSMALHTQWLAPIAETECVHFKLAHHSLDLGVSGGELGEFLSIPLLIISISFSQPVGNGDRCILLDKFCPNWQSMGTSSGWADISSLVGVHILVVIVKDERQ